jgi:hypothetical protein
MAVADIDLTDRIARLERKYRFAVVTAGVSALCAVVGLAGNMADRAVAAPAAAGGKAVTDVLRVRELNVVDPNGVTRVKIAAPLPNAVIDGRTLTRGGRPEDTVSGMLLFDAEGTERSGYATSDHGYSNVMFTLDDKTRQHAMFIAEPTGATTLRLFNGDTKDRLNLSINKDGPSISMMRRGKEIYRTPVE